jgi:predicted transcriptional regulator
MEVQLKPEIELRLRELASEGGRATNELIEDALAGYLDEAAELRELLDSRYEDINSGRVQPVKGEAFFEDLRRRENEPRDSRRSK